jgi:hypothetical protein
VGFAVSPITGHVGAPAKTVVQRGRASNARHAGGGRCRHRLPGVSRRIAERWRIRRGSNGRRLCDAGRADSLLRRNPSTSASAVAQTVTTRIVTVRQLYARSGHRHARRNRAASVSLHHRRTFSVQSGDSVSLAVSYAPVVPSALDSAALDRGIARVGETGFEPATPWSRTKCSTRLSHSPNVTHGRPESRRATGGL